MDLATFRASFPEFVGTSDATVTAKLAEAAVCVDARLPLADNRVGYLAAHLISISPFGQQARLSSDKGETTYMVEYTRLNRVVAGGPWTAGQGVDGMRVPGVGP